MDVNISKSKIKYYQKENISQTKISSLYTLRFICCLLVVIIHTPKELFDDLIRPLELIAVPIFFILSGYFLYKEDNVKLYEKVKKTIPKIFLLTLLLNIIYCIYLYPINGNPLFSLYQIVKQIFLGREILSVLWFMTDLLTGQLLILLIYKMNLQKYLYLSIIIIPIQILLTTYNPILGLGEEFNPVLKNLYHVLPMSLPYFWIGFFIKKNNKFLVSKFNWLKISFVFILLSYLEKLFISKYMHGNIGLEYISTPPLCVSIIVLMLQYPNVGKNTIFEKIGEYDSARIYYFHMIFAIGIPIIFDKIGNNFGYYELGFLYVFPMTLLFSRIVNWGQEKIGINLF